MSSQRILELSRRLQQFVDRPWYLPVVGLLGGLDLFVLIVPTDGLLVSAVLMRPKRWWQAALWGTLGCTLGAVALAALIQWDVEWVTHHLLRDVFETEVWRSTSALIHQYGALALAVVGATVLPQQPAVALAALARMPLPTLVCAFAVGRLVKFVVLAYGASHAPRLLMRIPLIRREVAAMQSPINP